MSVEQACIRFQSSSPLNIVVLKKDVSRKFFFPFWGCLGRVGWEGGDTFLSRSAGFCLIVVNVPWRVRGVAPSAPRAPEVRLLWSDNFRHFVVRGVLLNVDSGFWLLGFAIQS